MTFRMCRVASLALVVLSLMTGCASTSTPARQAPTIDVQDFYPLQVGNAWSYDVDTGEPSTVLAITRVESFDGRVAEVRTARAIVRYEVRADGIYVPEDDAWIIRAPLRPDATWPGRGGRTARLLSTDASAETPAGSFEGCVEVLEVGGKLELEVRTIYCPRVGPVSVVSTMRSNVSGRSLTVIARLRGFSVNPQ